MEKNNSSKRLACIDVLRGFDMFFLVGVGDILRKLLQGIGSDSLQPVQYQLGHADWTGFTAWDIIMPLFLFTSGLSMPFSFEKSFSRGFNKTQMLGKVVKRFAILFILGWIVQGNLLDLSLDKFHIYCNTLHAIAFGYLITAIIVLYINHIKGQLIAGGSLILVYWLAMTFIPVPGYGSGIFTPDGNLAIYIDHMVFGRFDDGTQYTWLLSSLGFGATVFSGYCAGLILKREASPDKILKILAFSGVVLIIAGLLWGLQMPVIKKIWSCSMILLSSGICFLLLALSYLITDKLKIESWWTQGLRMLGLNAIAAYIIYTVLGLNQNSALLLRGLKQYTGDFFPFFISSGGFILLFLIIRHMYKHKIFLKV